MVKKVISFSQIIGIFRENREKESETDTADLHLDELLKIYQKELLNKDQKPELTIIQRRNKYIQSVMIREA